jgi:hypothetical protein
VDDQARAALAQTPPTSPSPASPEATLRTASRSVRDRPRLLRQRGAARLRGLCPHARRRRPSPGPARTAPPIPARRRAAVGTEHHGHGRATPAAAGSKIECLRERAHDGEPVPDARRVLTWRDAAAVVDDFTTNRSPSTQQLTRIWPSDVRAIVGVKNDVADGLGHGEGDRVLHVVRSARRGREPGSPMPQLADGGGSGGQLPRSA